MSAKIGPIHFFCAEGERRGGVGGGDRHVLLFILPSGFTRSAVGRALGEGERIKDSFWRLSVPRGSVLRENSQSRLFLHPKLDTSLSKMCIDPQKEKILGSYP